MASKGRVSSCSGDDSCKVPSHWQDEAYSGPHRDPAAVAAMSGRGQARSTGATVKHEHLITYGGVAPCGATFGTAAGPNDGVTACGNCQVVHPLQWVCATCGEPVGFVTTVYEARDA